MILFRHSHGRHAATSAYAASYFLTQVSAGLQPATFFYILFILIYKQLSLNNACLELIFLPPEVKYEDFLLPRVIEMISPPEMSAH